MPGPPPTSEELETLHRRDRIDTLPDVDGQLAERLLEEESLSPPVPKSVSSPLSSVPPPRAVRGSDLPTVPGGGVNRVSHGRNAAAAYIGVKTVHSTNVPKQTRSAVKLASTLVEENSRFQTEPSLLRRALSPGPEEDPLTRSLSPRARRKGWRQERWSAVVLVGVLALLVGGLAVFAARYRPSASEERIVWEHGIDGQPGYLDQPSSSRGAREGNGLSSEAPAQVGESPESLRSDEANPLAAPFQVLPASGESFLQPEELSRRLSPQGPSPQGLPQQGLPPQGLSPQNPPPQNPNTERAKVRGVPSAPSVPEGSEGVPPGPGRTVATAGASETSAADPVRLPGSRGDDGSSEVLQARDNGNARGARAPASGRLTTTAEPRPNPSAEPDPTPRGAKESKQPWLE